MKNNIRIVRANFSLTTTASGYDHTHSYMHGYTLDLTRKTAVLMRQSRKGADDSNPESRLRQEGLARIAVEIRGDHDLMMVIECDEGSGVSGQKKIYERPKLLQLWEGIQNGTVGSVLVAREDRLFRDRFLTQVTTFAKECAERGVFLIVAGRRCYDFRIQDDFNAFIRKMQESYGYIDTHVRYMYEMKLQKLQRGEWVGGGLVAPYVLDRQAIQHARDQRKVLKELGADEAEDEVITQAFRPIIYAPWQPIAVELFQKFKLFDFSRARLGRYIEEKKYVFPIPGPDDVQKYIFKAHMKLIANLGYTFSDTACLPQWLVNLAHIGFASAGKDEAGNRVYIEGAFDAAIPRDLFEECYEAITGYTLSGEPGQISSNRSRFTRKHPTGQAQALLAQCFSSPDGSATFHARTAQPSKAYYFACAKRLVGEHEVALSTWDSNALWTLPVRTFDRAIVSRLTELAEHDKELATRVEHYYEELTKSRAGEKEAILQDIRTMQALIARYDHLLTNPAKSLSAAQEIRFLEAQQAAERDLEKAQLALKQYEQSQPNQFIPAFYRILGEAPGEFWHLDIDRQRRMLRLLVDDIQVENISPHLYRLRLKWKDPVAQRWDCALIFRRNALRSMLKGDDWSDADDALLHTLYPTADKLALFEAFPMKSGEAIKQRAAELKVKRVREHPASYSIIHRSLCYADWIQACLAMNVDQTSSEGRQVLGTLNYYARTTEKKGVAFWWLLPVMEMSDFERSLSARDRGSTFPSSRDLRRRLEI
ncbi:MAG TPA: recombinase family protein [Ktedonobacteraceae bacterium]|nr:recombinase family protein [Ktedonobacteraceae bacterium]